MQDIAVEVNLWNIICVCRQKCIIWLRRLLVESLHVNMIECIHWSSTWAHHHTATCHGDGKYIKLVSNVITVKHYSCKNEASRRFPFISNTLECNETFCRLSACNHSRTLFQMQARSIIAQLFSLPWAWSGGRRVTYRAAWKISSSIENWPKVNEQSEPLFLHSFGNFLKSDDIILVQNWEAFRIVVIVVLIIHCSALMLLCSRQKQFPTGTLRSMV